MTTAASNSLATVIHSACSFLGHYGSSPHDNFLDFSDAIVRVDGGMLCGFLDPIVQDDLVDVWAKNVGVESYTTTIGGSNAYTVMELVDIVRYGHDD